MRKLLTLSALLLFSVDVFADMFADEYCYVSATTHSSLEIQIRDRCNKDDVVYAHIDNGLLDGGLRTVSMNSFAVAFCDFENEIIINSDDNNKFLLCVLNDNEPRKISR
jgi:hypothetical protein